MNSNFEFNESHYYAMNCMASKRGCMRVAKVYSLF